jgi:mono/diheme cytochrome c family protein
MRMPLAMPKPSLSLLLLCCVHAPQPTLQADEKKDERYEKVIQPFFQEHCTKCHGESKQEGNLRVDTLEVDLTSPEVKARWKEILQRINAGEMPPDKEIRPDADKVAQVAEWIMARIRESKTSPSAGDGKKYEFQIRLPGTTRP